MERLKNEMELKEDVREEVANDAVSASLRLL